MSQNFIKIGLVCCGLLQTLVSTCFCEHSFIGMQLHDVYGGSSSTNTKGFTLCSTGPSTFDFRRGHLRFLLFSDTLWWPCAASVSCCKEPGRWLAKADDLWHNFILRHRASYKLSFPGLILRCSSWDTHRSLLLLKSPRLTQGFLTDTWSCENQSLHSTQWKIHASPF